MAENLPGRVCKCTLFPWMVREATKNPRTTVLRLAEIGCILGRQVSKRTIKWHPHTDKRVCYGKHLIPTVKYWGGSLMFGRCFAASRPGSLRSVAQWIEQSTRTFWQKIWLSPLRSWDMVIGRLGPAGQWLQTSTSTSKSTKVKTISIFGNGNLSLLT